MSFQAQASLGMSHTRPYGQYQVCLLECMHICKDSMLSQLCITVQPAVCTVLDMHMPWPYLMSDAHLDNLQLVDHGACDHMHRVI